MKSTLTATFAALESAAIALALFALLGVPAFLTWWVTFALAAEPKAVLAGVAAAWSLSHGVPLQFTIDADLVAGLGLSPAAITFGVSVIPLGITAITVICAARMGARFAPRGGAGLFGVAGGALGYAGAALIVALLAQGFLAAPVWWATLLPALVYLVAALISYLWCSALQQPSWWQRASRLVLVSVARTSARFAAALPAYGSQLMRAATALTLALLGLGACAAACALLLSYVDIVSLSQSLQLSGFGIVALFGVQLVLLPTAMIWAVAWFTGVGLTAGAGSVYTPFFVTSVPLPPLPLFGALPSDWGWAAALAPAVVVCVGVAVGAALAGQATFRRFGWVAATVVPLLAAVLAGVVWAFLAAIAGGSLGPGRLSEFGVSVGPFVLALTAEIAVGMSIGVWGRRADFRLRGGVTRKQQTLAQQAEAVPHQLGLSASSGFVPHDTKTAATGIRARLSALLATRGHPKQLHAAIQTAAERDGAVPLSKLAEAELHRDTETSSVPSTEELIKQYGWSPTGQTGSTDWPNTEAPNAVAPTQLLPNSVAEHGAEAEASTDATLPIEANAASAQHDRTAPARTQESQRHFTAGDWVDASADHDTVELDRQLRSSLKKLGRRWRPQPPQD